MPCSTVQVADEHVEMVDAFVYLGSMIDSSGGSRGEVLRRIGIARSCMNLLEKKNLEVKHQAGYQNTPLYQTYIIPVLLYVCDGPPQSSSALALMHLTCEHYARS